MGSALPSFAPALFLILSNWPHLFVFDKREKTVGVGPRAAAFALTHVVSGEQLIDRLPRRYLQI